MAFSPSEGLSPTMLPIFFLDQASLSPHSGLTMTSVKVLAKCPMRFTAFKVMPWCG